MRSINPGLLRNSVVIQTYVPTSVNGSEVRAYTSSGSTPAQIEALSGRELLAAQSVSSDVQYRVTVRYQAGIRASARVVYGTRTFEVLAVLQDEQSKRFTQLLCKANG